MKPAPFKYLAPTEIEEALAQVAEHGYDAKVLAGGQSLIPVMNFRLAQPSVLVDINRIAELFFIRPDENGGIRIGAMTRQAQIEKSPLVAERAPLLHDAMPRIAYPQIRSRGTYGGSIAHADPSAELPAVSVAMNGRFRLRKQSGDRWVSASDFFVALFTTAMEPDELLVEIALPPMPARSGWSFIEISRRHHDFAMAGVAAVTSLDSKGRCQHARTAFFSVGDGPMYGGQAEAVLLGKVPSQDLIRQAAEIASRQDVDPGGDIHATAAYRRHLVKVLAQRALEEAFERAKNR
jgi:carbon-monoxide dehydrogenase medium subunit